MYRSFNLILSLGLGFICILWLIVNPLLAAKPTPTTKPEPLEPLPIWMQAETLTALQDKTKPTISYLNSSQRHIFVWVKTNKNGNLFFQVAEAQQLPAIYGQMGWAIYSAPAICVSSDFRWVERQTITAVDLPAAPEPSSPWYRILSHNPQGGTLYEIEYGSKPNNDTNAGTRLILLQDLKKQWHYVTEVEGNFWDDTLWESLTQLQVKWTEDPHQPCIITATIHSYYNDGMHGDYIAPDYWEVDTYSGPIPWNEPQTTINYLLVRPGETYSVLVRQLIENGVWQIELEGKAVNEVAARMALAKEIQQLNPELVPEHIRVGQKILIPEYKKRLSLIKSFEFNVSKLGEAERVAKKHDVDYYVLLKQAETSIIKARKFITLERFMDGGAAEDFSHDVTTLFQQLGDNKAVALFAQLDKETQKSIAGDILFDLHYSEKSKESSDWIDFKKKMPKLAQKILKK